MLKKSNSDKLKKLNCENSNPQIVTKFKNSNWDKTQTMKIQKIKLIQNLKKKIVTTQN